MTRPPELEPREFYLSSLPSPDPYCAKDDCCVDAGRVTAGEQIAHHADADAARELRWELFWLVVLLVGVVLFLPAFVWFVLVQGLTR